ALAGDGDLQDEALARNRARQFAAAFERHPFLAVDGRAHASAGGLEAPRASELLPRFRAGGDLCGLEFFRPARPGPVASRREYVKRAPGPRRPAVRQVAEVVAVQVDPRAEALLDVGIGEN